MPKVLITTVPFGEKNRLPLELLENANIEYLINPLNKKMTEDQEKGQKPQSIEKMEVISLLVRADNRGLGRLKMQEYRQVKWMFLWHMIPSL